MRKVYAELLPGVPYVPLLYPTIGRQQRDSILFLNYAFDHLKDPLVQMVDDPKDADDLLLAHNYSAVRHHRAYLQRYADLSSRYSRRVIVFAHGDGDFPVALPHALVFRTSLYRSAPRSNEIAMPAYAEDLLGADPLMLRQKGEKPVVGFCGWAEYKNVRNRMGTYAGNAIVEAQSLLRGSRWRARRKGLTLRREALRILSSSRNVATNFLIRSSYSGNQKTIRLDPLQARRDYRENLLGSDLALVIKGDGNYSYRFYEALSLGRVPAFVDTDCVLPLENVIDYDRFLLRIDWRDLSRIEEKILSFYEALSPGEFTQKQRWAREAFAGFLRIDQFLAYAIQHLL